MFGQRFNLSRFTRFLGGPTRPKIFGGGPQLISRTGHYIVMIVLILTSMIITLMIIVRSGCCNSTWYWRYFPDLENRQPLPVQECLPSLLLSWESCSDRSNPPEGLLPPPWTRWPCLARSFRWGWRGGGGGGGKTRGHQGTPCPSLLAHRPVWWNMNFSIERLLH